jgi:hypothetical protein
MEVGQKIIAVGKETALYIMSDGWVYISLQKYTPFVLKVSYVTFLQASPQTIRFSIEIITLSTFLEFSFIDFVTGPNKFGTVPMCFGLSAHVVTATILAGRTFRQISQPDLRHNFV